MSPKMKTVLVLLLATFLPSCAALQQIKESASKIRDVAADWSSVSRQVTDSIRNVKDALEDKVDAVKAEIKPIMDAVVSIPREVREKVDADKDGQITAGEVVSWILGGSGSVGVVGLIARSVASDRRKKKTEEQVEELRVELARVKAMPPSAARDMHVDKLTNELAETVVVT